MRRRFRVLHGVERAALEAGDFHDLFGASTAPPGLVGSVVRTADQVVNALNGRDQPGDVRLVCGNAGNIVDAQWVVLNDCVPEHHALAAEIIGRNRSPKVRTFLDDYGLRMVGRGDDPLWAD